MITNNKIKIVLDVEFHKVLNKEKIGTFLVNDCIIFRTAKESSINICF